MLFSAPTFLFLFLPILCLLTWLAPRTWRNSLLLLASLAFYAWGETVYVLLMLASITGNHFLVRVLETSEGEARRRLLFAAVVGNLGCLVVFKYTGYLLGETQRLFETVGASSVAASLASVPVPDHLPIGISFFTFQALSYVFDVYRGEVPAQSRWSRVALYISLFPQLIAGPIVRYHQIREQLESRSVSVEDVAAGLRRFVRGLAKKVLIANTVAVAADSVFALPAEQLTPSVAWFGAVCYAVQIYFDFSGYSDMAIGLGRVFGFRFPENFEFPYAARSITEFWRRWHISLSSWFRDYLYIPLGGNRAGPARTYRNLVLVFVLCGLWHGANTTFLVWGLYHGGFLVLERHFRGKSFAPPLASWLYCALVVTVGWVFFRAESLPYAFAMLGAMAGFAAAGADAMIVHHASLEVVLALVVASLFSSPAVVLGLGARIQALRTDWASQPILAQAYASVSAVGVAGLLVACVTRLAMGSYNPFIYFRF